MSEAGIWARTGLVAALVTGAFALAANGSYEKVARSGPQNPSHCINPELDNTAFLSGCVGDVVGVMRANPTVFSLFDRTLNDIDQLGERLKDGRLSHNAYIALVQGHFAVMEQRLDGVPFRGDWDVKVSMKDASEVLKHRAHGKMAVMTGNTLIFD